MFNFWRRYPRFKPKKAGWYQCTVITGDDCSKLKVMDLYYLYVSMMWIDRRRQDVFDGYQVYKPCRAPIAENHVYRDILCDRTLAVVAWRKLPKPCRWKARKEHTPL